MWRNVETPASGSPFRPIRISRYYDKLYGDVVLPTPDLLSMQKPLADAGFDTFKIVLRFFGIVCGSVRTQH
jgi:hypothetical protein